MNIVVKMNISPPKSAIHAGNKVYRRRHLLNRVMLGLSMGALIFGLFWLAWILYTLLVKGGGALSLQPGRDPLPVPDGDGD